MGSIRHNLFGLTPSSRIAAHARRHQDVEVDLIDLADFDLLVVLGGNDENAPQPDVVTALKKAALDRPVLIPVRVDERAYHREGRPGSAMLLCQVGSLRRP